MTDIVTKDSRKIRMKVSGSEITTLVETLIPRINFTGYTQNTSTNRTAGLDKIDYNLLTKSCSEFFKIDLAAFVQKAYDAGLPYTGTWQFRFVDNPTYGLNLTIVATTVDNNYVGLNIQTFSVVNGTVSGNMTGMQSGIMAVYPVTPARAENNKRNSTSKNGKDYWIPVLACSTSAAAANGYFGFFVDYVSGVDPYKVPGVRMASSDSYNRMPFTVIENNEGTLFPKPGEEETGNGEPTDDDYSEDIDYPDDTLTDDIDEILRDGDFVTTYKLNKAQLQLVGSKLWDENIFATIKKVINNPMDGIISLQAFPFVVPSTSNVDFKICNVEMGFTAGKVDKNHVLIDCGELELGEYWGSFLDYNGTKVKIFLPFVGIQELSIQMAMDASIGVKYKVDLITGSFLCWVRYVKDGKTQVLNRFTGSCSLQVPVTSAMHTGITNAIMSTQNVAQSLMQGMTGNPVGYAGAALGTANAAIDALKMSYQHTGNYNMNIGFMDTRKPYLIIERVKAQTPTSYAKEKGIPSFVTAKLSTCSGFTVVDDIELDFAATEAEKAEILSILKSGIIL